MRRKYIEDFSELERMLVMDTNFIQGKLAAILIFSCYFCDFLKRYIRILMMYLKEKESEKGEKI